MYCTHIINTNFNVRCNYLRLIDVTALINLFVIFNRFLSRCWLGFFLNTNISQNCNINVQSYMFSRIKIDWWVAQTNNNQLFVFLGSPV